MDLCYNLDGNERVYCINKSEFNIEKQIYKIKEEYISNILQLNRGIMFNDTREVSNTFFRNECNSYLFYIFQNNKHTKFL
jgi:hypothetical protein